MKKIAFKISTYISIFLVLPILKLFGKKYYETNVVPKLLTVLCNTKPNHYQRKKVVPLATGDVVEIGVGPGLNLQYYNFEKVNKVIGIDPSDELNKIAKKNNIDTSGPFIGESYDAAAILILALQEKNFKSNNNLSKNIMSVSNSPGTKIYPGEIAKGLKLLKKGKKIDYEGATNVEFNINGDAFGTFLEKEISKGKFRTRQQR